MMCVPRKLDGRSLRESMLKCQMTGNAISSQDLRRGKAARTQKRRQIVGLACVASDKAKRLYTQFGK